MGNIYRLSKLYVVHQIQQRKLLILNLAELQNQDREIKLCKVPAHIEMKGNEKQIKQQNKQ